MAGLILGIDDAGRGSVIGPMVLAGCLISLDAEKKLKSIGVRDSKELTPKRRAFLAEKIKELSETFETVIIYPEEIDGNGATRTKLNELEAIASSKIINSINKGFSKIRIVVDCPSTNKTKWKNHLLTLIENLSNLEVFCEHKADKNHVAVSAASILAKETREKEMQILREKYSEDIGSGYPSDPLTMKFLEKYAVKYQDKGIFRKTWETWKKANRNLSQKKLFSG